MASCSRVKFVSYDGRFPNLCSGTLVLNIDGNDVTFPKGSMCSGGSVSFTKDWEEIVTSGDWLVRVPKEFEDIQSEINYVVNENVPKGCCGGCV